MKQLRYQQTAVRRLVDCAIDLLRLTGHRKPLVFKAPTGSGKTVMVSQMLSDLTVELQSRGDSPFHEVAFMWIAPNKLHFQSYSKMKGLFDETHLLRPVMYDELDHADGFIHPGEILFVNWESVNKDNALIIRDSEQGASLYDITRRTQDEQGIPIVVVIDEEHLFWSRTADKSSRVLQRIQPKLEIRVSATPKTYSDYIVNIPREQVVEEEMIKKQVVLNPDITQGYADDRELNQHLMLCALRKRHQLADAYRRQGININPLLLIQLPNDTSVSMTADDNAITEQVRAYLQGLHGINEQNGRLAVWLSKEKANLDGIEEFDSPVEVLLFKQAIALGWDCPRAAVLLIFRKLQSNQFTIQTVGRILRMPEQRFYTDNLLNVGYVYTDISRDQIQIVADDMDYLNKDTLQAIRREGLKNVSLASYYSERKSADRNRLGPDFKAVLAETFQRHWLLTPQPMLFTLEEMDGSEPTLADGAQGAALTGYEMKSSSLDATVASNRRAVEGKVRLDVRNVNVEIPTDLTFQNEVGVVSVTHQRKFARTAGELHRIYIHFCRSLLGHYEKAHSTDVLAGYLLIVMEDLFNLFETDAIKVILYHDNKSKFADIVAKALNVYDSLLAKRKKQARERGFEEYRWEVPSERLYKEATHRTLPKVEHHALLPFIEQRQASTPEQRFSLFLERQCSHIDWWYKNGDVGKQHYAIPYVTSGGEKALFYVDFIVRTTSGQLFLFDTKTSGSDIDAPEKHNALLEYMHHPGRESQHLMGGILVEQNEVWYYSQQPIHNTNDVTGWTAFFPDEYGQK